MILSILAKLTLIGLSSLKAMPFHLSGIFEGDNTSSESRVEMISVDC